VEIEENVRVRDLGGFMNKLGRGLLIAIPVAGIFFLLNLPQHFGWLVFNEQYMGLFLGLALCATFLLVPFKPTSGRNTIPWYDAVASVTGLAGSSIVRLGPMTEREVGLCMGAGVHPSWSRAVHAYLWWPVMLRFARTSLCQDDEAQIPVVERSK